MRKGLFPALIALAGILVLVQLGTAVVWQVGPTRTYTLPSQVVSLVGAGDTVAIDAATYADVGSWRANNLVIRGVGGRARLDATGIRIAEDKAIWVIKGRNAIVEDIEFTGAYCVDSNGAGIRQEGSGLTVRSCLFRDNQEGILAGADTSSNILIEYSEFDHNGAGDGYSHNMYIGGIRSFTLRYSWSHRVVVGHQVKSRAAANYILYNCIMDEDSGNASREIDLPNGGSSFLIGNLIQKGRFAENSGMIGYGLEGITSGYDTTIEMVNNTMVNVRTPTGPFVQLAARGRLLLDNNIFFGSNQIVSGGHHQGTRNWVPLGHTGDDSLTNSVAGTDPGLVNRAGYDYHLAPESPCIDSGITPDSSLRPVYQYVHPCNVEPRPEQGALDIGAYEYSGGSIAREPGLSRSRRTPPSAAPNPFVSFTVLLGQAHESFAAYDVRGCRVGTYPGNRVGSDLAPGVYLLRAEKQPGELRIIKLR